MAYTPPWNLLGLSLSGDIDGLSTFTDKNGHKVVFPKAPPDKPPTVLQVNQRRRFAEAQESWKVLTDEEKFSLEELCRKAGAVLTGQNIWIHTALTNDQEAMLTLIRQTGITVPIPDYVA